MPSKTSPDLQLFIDEFIAPGIKAAIEHEVRVAIEKAKAQAMQELDWKIPEIMGGIAVHVANMISAERVGREIRITVELPEKKS